MSSNEKKQNAGLIALTVIALTLSLCIIIYMVAVSWGGEADPTPDPYSSGAAASATPAPSPSPAAPSADDGGGSASIVVNNAMATMALGALLGEEVPLSGATVSFGADGNIAVSGSLDRDGFLALLDTAASLPSAVRALLGALPQEMALEAAFEPSIDPDTGKIKTNPTSFSVGGLTLEGGLMPTSITGKVDALVNDYVGSQARVTRIQVEEDRLELDIES